MADKTNIFPRGKKIYIAGHKGMVGSAIFRELKRKNYSNILIRNREELDLTNQSDVYSFMKVEKPDYIFLAAAKVGGIYANNTYRAEFLYQNLMIETNIIHAAFQVGIKEMLFLGSSCIYPRDCPQPIKEEYLLTGPLERTNEPYAIAKIVGIKLLESYNLQYGTNYISIMPTNLFGSNDNYDPETSHVLPALIRKIHEAKIHGDSRVSLWGTGQPLREFLYVDDLAEACVFLMEQEVRAGLYNIGTGTDLSIRELAEIISKIIGFKGEITFDPSMPDGTPRKLLNIDKIKHLGWKAKTPLVEGIAQAYSDFLSRIPFL